MPYETTLDYDRMLRSIPHPAWPEIPLQDDSEEVDYLLPQSEAPQHVAQQQALQNPPFAADSPRVQSVVPANIGCGMERNAQGALLTRDNQDVTLVVIHTMVGGFQFNVHTSWRTSTSGQGCFKPHYAVRNDGLVAQVVLERLVPRHANSANLSAIGIEHDGFANDPGFYTEAMYAASAALTRDICGRRGIPMNRSRIIAHEEVHDASHADPGGYWDWDYYLALVQWDGNADSRPVRIVMDTSSPHSARTGTQWAAVNRVANPIAPQAVHSWGRTSFQAPPSPASGVAPDAAFFVARIPVTGNYEVGAWWPIQPANNSETPFIIGRGNPPNPLLGGWVNQAELRGRMRPTRPGLTVPDWFALGKVALQAGDLAWVVIFRGSRKPGLIRADAVRFLKR